MFKEEPAAGKCEKNGWHLVRLYNALLKTKGSRDSAPFILIPSKTNQRIVATHNSFRRVENESEAEPPD